MWSWSVLTRFPVLASVVPPRWRVYDCAFSGIAPICLVPVQNLCFTKKIRYENRKQLAQARPRLRGQFVRVDDAGAGAAVEVLDGGEAPSSAAALAAAVAAGTARLVPEVKPPVP